MAAVAAVRAARRDVFLAVKRDRAVAAVAGLDVNFCFIDKHGVPLLSSRNRHLLPYRYKRTILLILHRTL